MDLSKALIQTSVTVQIYICTLAFDIKFRFKVLAHVHEFVLLKCARTVLLCGIYILHVHILIQCTCRFTCPFTCTCACTGNCQSRLQQSKPFIYINAFIRNTNKL